jgi:hypothetical protein
MAVVSHFPFLDSRDAGSQGLWAWAKRLIDALNRWKLFNLMDVPLSGKPYYVIRINADGTDFELVPEELGLTGQNLAGLGNEIIRVKAAEDGYFIDKEVLHTLVGASLAGKAKYIVRVNNAADGFIYDKEVLHSLVGVSLAGKAGLSVKVKADETGFEIV